MRVLLIPLVFILLVENLVNQTSSLTYSSNIAVRKNRLPSPSEDLGKNSCEGRRKSVKSLLVFVNAFRTFESQPGATVVIRKNLWKEAKPTAKNAETSGQTNTFQSPNYKPLWALAASLTFLISARYGC